MGRRRGGEERVGGEGELPWRLNCLRIKRKIKRGERFYKSGCFDCVAKNKKDAIITQIGPEIAWTLHIRTRVHRTFINTWPV